MRIRGIHQLVAGYSNGDAISNEARTLRSWFRSWGFESEIYCDAARILPELRKDSRDIRHLLSDAGPEDLIILHLSIGSEINTLFAKCPGPKMLRYHNVTPSNYFRALNEPLAALLAQGRRQMKELAGVADITVADSAFNAAELTEAGHSGAQVLPLALELKRLHDTPNQEVLRKYDDGKLNVLFVGRCVPNKRFEDLLYAFYYLQNFQTPDCRLLMVGSAAGSETYRALLQSLGRDLKLRHVEFAGSVLEPDLCAYYRLADVFVCMSEHEGFGIPLLEAMQADIPVMAYASSAVPETMDGAGLLFTEKYFDELAVWMQRLAQPGPLREQILQGQRERIQRYEQQDVQTRLRELLAPWLSVPSPS